MSIRKFKNFILNKLQNELSAKLSYHGTHHTIFVLDTVNQYIKRLKIKKHQAYLLRTASLIHDVGICWKYENHEVESIQFAYEILPAWGYSASDLKIIEGLIMATKIPQSPKSLLEKILCDADLDYIGTDQFYSIGNTLFKEFLAYKIIKNEEEWDLLQINFLSQHYFHTKFAKNNREPIKQKYLLEIKKKWNIS